MWYNKVKHKTQNTKGQTKHNRQSTKIQNTNRTRTTNKTQMEKTQNTNRYRELEERTTEFARNIIRLCKNLPQDRINNQLVGQIVRSAGSVGANYREANEALGKKDFAHRLRIARKEAKETQHWLELIEEANHDLSGKMNNLFRETQEIRNILSAIIVKAQNI